MCGGFGFDGSSGGAGNWGANIPQGPQFQQLGQSIHKLMQPVQAYEQAHQPQAGLGAQPGMARPQPIVPPVQGGGATPGPARAPGAYDA